MIFWAGDCAGSCLAPPKEESGIAGSDYQPSLPLICASTQACEDALKVSCYPFYADGKMKSTKWHFLLIMSKASRLNSRICESLKILQCVCLLCL